LIIPIGAWALYAMIGSQSLIPQLEQLAASGRSTVQAGGSEMPPLSELVARIEQRLEQQPDDAEGWTMLGRTYFAIGNRAQAEEALARAYALEPNDTMILLTYAEAIASNNDSQLEGKPAELISKALELEPENTTARWLAAMVAFQRGQFRSAATSWKRLLDGMDPASEEAAELRSMIEEAERRAGTPPPARQLADATTGPGTASAPADNGPPTAVSPERPQPEPTAAEATTVAAEPMSAAGPGAQAAPTPAGDVSGAPGLSVNVRLAPDLAGRYPPSTTLFVFARAASGPPMPLAVQRVTLGDLPVRVRLDDSMAMMPAMRLSAFPQVIVGARVSPSAQAMPRPGDLEGETGPVVSSTADPVDVLIDRIRP
jgi:cytochrome c-type biogenesis protein CcmH